MPLVITTYSPPTTTMSGFSTLIFKVLGIILFILAAYNLAKIPWYIGWQEIPSYGLEASIPFSLIGFRNVKLISHPTLFLFPHALMGSCLLVLFGIYLWSDSYSQWMGKAFFGLAVVFALHAFPERAGVPNRTSGQPLNEIAIGLVVIGCFLGWLLPQVGMWIVVIPLLAAAVMEARGPIPYCIQKLMGQDPVSESPDGDSPLPRNMEGYTGCPCAKFFDIDKSVYGDGSSANEYTPIAGGS